MIETLSTETVVTSPWIKVRKDAVRYPSGAEGTYYVVDRIDAALVLPMIGNDILLVRQFRYPVKKWCIEVVAGLIDEGETAEEAAMRELKEEVGAVASGMTPLGVLDANPGMMNQKMHVFLAAVDRLEENAMEQTEVLEMMRVPFEEAVRMVHDGEITGTPSVSAILLAAAALHRG